MKYLFVLLALTGMMVEGHDLCCAGSDNGPQLTPEVLKKRWIVGLGWDRAQLTGPFVVSARVTDWFQGNQWRVEVLPIRRKPNRPRDVRQLRTENLEVMVGDSRAEVRICQAASFEDARDLLAGGIVLIMAPPEVNVKWEDRTIGTLALGYHSRGLPEEPLRGVRFMRGNVEVRVSVDRGNVAYLDPRRVAAAIDAYLKRAPKVPDPATDRFQGVSLKVEAPAGGTEPPGLPAGTVAAATEYRLMIDPLPPILPVAETRSDTQPATRIDGEIQIRASGGSVSRTAEGTYTVRFYKPGKQTLECWYLNPKGAVTAYGKTTVTVRKREPEASQGERPRTAAPRAPGSNPEGPAWRAEIAARLVGRYGWSKIKGEGPFVLGGNLPRRFAEPDWETEALPADSGGVRDPRLLRVDFVKVRTAKGPAVATVCQTRSFEEARMLIAEAHILISAPAQLGVRWEGKSVGTISGGFLRRGATEEQYRCVTFARGNVAVMVTADRDVALDARLVAAAIDAYLNKAPKVPDPATDRFKGVSLKVQAPAGSTEPAGLPAGTVAAATEYRLMIDPLPPIGGIDDTRSDTEPVRIEGEMQIRASGGSVSRTPEGTYRVRFYQPGKQTLECWYLNPKGAVTAYGKTTVTVRKPEPEASQGERPRTAPPGEPSSPRK